MFSYNNKFYKPDSFFKKLLKMDWLLLFLVLIVCIIGVGALYSAGDGSLNPWAINHISVSYTHLTLPTILLV